MPSIFVASTTEKRKRKPRRNRRHKRATNLMRKRVNNKRVRGTVNFEGGILSVRNVVKLSPPPVQTTQLTQSLTDTVL